MKTHSMPTISEKLGYTYDASQNQILRSTETTKNNMYVAARSNRSIGAALYGNLNLNQQQNLDTSLLQTGIFDRCGNQLKTSTYGNFAFDFQNNIQKTTSPIKNQTINEYSVFGQPGKRTQKITEILDSNGAIIMLIITTYQNYVLEYLYDYQGNNLYYDGQTVTENGNEVAPTNQSHRLRILEDHRQIAEKKHLLFKAGKVINKRQTHWSLDNLIDSIQLRLDKNSSGIAFTDYYPYGKRWIGEKSHDYGYSGEEKDSNNSIHYGYRNYLPENARWTAPDPEGLIDGTNKYGFVKNNPISFRDLFGLQTLSNSEISAISSFILIYFNTEYSGIKGNNYKKNSNIKLSNWIVNKILGHIKSDHFNVHFEQTNKTGIMNKLKSMMTGPTLLEESKNNIISYIHAYIHNRINENILPNSIRPSSEIARVQFNSIPQLISTGKIQIQIRGTRLGGTRGPTNIPNRKNLKMRSKKNLKNKRNSTRLRTQRQMESLDEQINKRGEIERLLEIKSMGKLFTLANRLISKYTNENDILAENIPGFTIRDRNALSSLVSASVNVKQDSIFNYFSERRERARYTANLAFNTFLENSNSSLNHKKNVSNILYRINTLESIDMLTKTWATQLFLKRVKNKKEIDTTYRRNLDSVRHSEPSGHPTMNQVKSFLQKNEQKQQQKQRPQQQIWNLNNMESYIVNSYQNLRHSSDWRRLSPSDQRMITGYNEHLTQSRQMYKTNTHYRKKMNALANIVKRIIMTR